MGDEPRGTTVDFRLRLGDLGGEGDPPGPDAAVPVPGAEVDDREALRLLQSAARAEPDDPDYYHILGEALLRAGRVQEAVGACREAVDRDPLNPDYRYALGCALWRLDQILLAETAFRESLQRRPDDPGSLNALGAALVRLHREAEAVSTLERASKIDPTSGDACSNLGVALWGTGDRPGALRSFQRAIRLDPEEPDLHRNLALAQRAVGRAPEAVNVLQGMVRRWPTRADLHLDLAEALHDAGRPSEATRSLDEAQRLDPRAIAKRPRSREIRDALRLQAVKGEIEGERDPRPGVLAAVLHLPFDAIEYVGKLTPPFKLAGALVLIALLAVGGATSRLLPHYVSRYLLQDDITVIARAPVRDDAIVRDRLSRAIQRRGLEEHLGPDGCRVDTEPGWRQISCIYAVEAELLPGLRRTLRFHIDVEEPYLVDPDPLIL